MSWLVFMLTGFSAGLIVGVLIDKDKVYNISNRNKKGTLTIDDIEVKEKPEKRKRLRLFKRKG